MRVKALAFIFLLSIPTLAFAQEWEEYTSLQDGFRLNFPGQPKVSEITWTSQLNYVLPGRVYTAEKNGEKYSLTVVDYSSITQQGIERAKTCPPGNANCRASAPEALGAGYARHDERGAIVFATFKLLQRDAKLNYMTYEWQDLVEGHIVQLTNADRSRTFAWIGMRAHKLYILEGTVAEGRPEPGLFQQSMQWVDKNGNGVRYQSIYSNSFHGMGLYPEPAIVGGGGGGGGDATGQIGR
jgi:hypothetical protein